MVIDYFTFIFTSVFILSGIAFGWFCFEAGKKFGHNKLLEDLSNLGIIQIDEDGNVIPAEQ